MSILICESCGELTQSDVCNLQEVKDYMVAKECYARMMDGSRIWVKGCVYDHCDSFAKSEADKLIKGLKDTGPC